MAKVPEYHTTIKYNGYTYYIRPFRMSDKAFFVETMADFPTEAIAVDYAYVFEKRINMWLSHLETPNKGYLPMVKGHNNFPNNVLHKNETPVGIQYCDMFWEEDEAIVQNHTIAIHPSFRGQGLRKILDANGQFWTYSDNANLPVKRVEFEIPHNDTSALQWQKDNGSTHTSSRPANTFGATNNSVLSHSFYHTPAQRFDFAPGATFEVTLHEFDFTNDRYGTEYVTSGQRALDISGTTQQWDRDL